MGAKLVKEVATKTQDVAGDGTTTATLLAQAILHKGMKNITVGANPIEIKRGIDKATETVVKAIKNMSEEVKTKEKITQVATISANNDDEIGSLISMRWRKWAQTALLQLKKQDPWRLHWKL